MESLILYNDILIPKTLYMAKKGVRLFRLHATDYDWCLPVILFSFLFDITLAAVKAYAIFLNID